MKWTEYLSGKIILICAVGIMLVFLTAFLYAMGGNAGLYLCADGGIVIILLLYLVGEYRYIQCRLKRIYDTMDKMEEVYLMGEVMEKPKGAIEREYYEIMKAISASAIGQVEKARQEKKQYQEYVESWVHELKTPLTACSLILQNDGDRQKIKRELRRADNLTETVLYYARLMDVEKDVQITKVSKKDLMHRAIQDEMELLIAAGISVEITLHTADTSEGVYVHTDAKQVVFIIKQLLINCAKYCVGCHIEMIATKDSIIITDDGPGILPHELSRIKQKGFTGKQWRIQGNSTGMGLYIVDRLCRQLNIACNVESEYGVYTRVTLCFL